MITNRILNVILGILTIPVIPIKIVTTLVLGIAVNLTFGLLLLPFSLIWMLLYFPMLGLSWVGNRVPVFREVIGIIFLPWVIVADTFVALMPSMGELESHAIKMMLCGTWPFTWEFSQFLSGKIDLESADINSVDLNEIVNRISAGIPIMQQVIMRAEIEQRLDPKVRPI